MKDIFGQDLVIGNMYIRAHNSNGSTDIKIGELIKINDKTVTLDIQVRASAYREEDVKLTISTYYRARKICVYSNSLFPFIEGTSIDWF